MVGDRLSTDIRMGLDSGMAVALVLTGETGADDLAALAPQDRPAIVLDRIDRLLPADIWSELGWDEQARCGGRLTPCLSRDAPRPTC